MKKVYNYDDVYDDICLHGRKTERERFCLLFFSLSAKQCLLLERLKQVGCSHALLLSFEQVKRKGKTFYVHESVSRYNKINSIYYPVVHASKRQDFN